MEYSHQCVLIIYRHIVHIGGESVYSMTFPETDIEMCSRIDSFIKSDREITVGRAGFISNF